MNVSLEIIGPSCDLALHPISAKTAEIIRTRGRRIYAEKYLNWWRKGNTATFGMRLGEDSVVRLFVDGARRELDEDLFLRNVMQIRRRMYLESSARYLAVLGYDDQWCHKRWTWEDVDGFDPARFDFAVFNWDRIMGTEGYFVLDNVRYDRRFPDTDEWCDTKGFTLISPVVIDLDKVRSEVAAEKNRN